MRLTERTTKGHAYYPECFKPPCNGDGCKKELCEFSVEVCSRLADYEDTGLTPEQIRQIDELYAEKCRELAEERKKHAWILCSERMPDMHRENMDAGEYYMISDPVIVTDGNRIYVAEYEEDDGYRYGWHSLEGETYNYKDIIAWISLPSPYNPEESE